LSQWVTRKIKALKKNCGTSLEGLEEEVIGFFLSLEVRRKQQMLEESA